jgi:hypothetical protein
VHKDESHGVTLGGMLTFVKKYKAENFSEDVEA